MSERMAISSRDAQLLSFPGNYHRSPMMATCTKRMENICMPPAPKRSTTELLGRVGRGAGHGEVAQGVSEPAGIAVEPVEPALVDRVEDAILAGHLGVEQRLGGRGLAAEQDGVAIDAVAGDPVQALGDVQPPDLEFHGPAGLGLQDHATDAESVPGELVTVGRDAEEDPPAHQSRLVAGNQAAPAGLLTPAPARPHLH